MSDTPIKDDNMMHLFEAISHLKTSLEEGNIPKICIYAKEVVQEMSNIEQPYTWE